MPKEDLAYKFQKEPKVQLKPPLFASPVKAGFPSPADDSIEKKLDLNQFLIKHPSATFFVRVDGDSMKGAGIYDKDLLIVDRALSPKSGQIVVAVLNGEFTVKRLRVEKGEFWLQPENKNYKPIQITPENDFVIWGIVTNVIKKV